MEKKKIVAFWDIYEYTTGLLLEKQRMIDHNAMPGVGQLVVGIPGKPQVIVKDFRFKGSKDNLPYYDVYI
jgi:hypothetical protein